MNELSQVTKVCVSQVNVLTLVTSEWAAFSFASGGFIGTEQIQSVSHLTSTSSAQVATVCCCCCCCCCCW